MIQIDDGGQYAYAKGQVNLCDTLLGYAQSCTCNLERMIEFIEELKRSQIEMIARIQKDKLRIIMGNPKFWKEQDPEYVDTVEKLQAEAFPKELNDRS